MNRVEFGRKLKIVDQAHQAIIVNHFLEVQIVPCHQGTTTVKLGRVIGWELQGSKDAFVGGSDGVLLLTFTSSCFLTDPNTILVPNNRSEKVTLDST